MTTYLRPGALLARLVRFTSDIFARSSSAERHLCINAYIEQLAGTALTPSLMLTPETLRALTLHRIENGVQPVSHLILTSLDVDSARYAIEERKLRLEAISDSPVRFFAYPNGNTGIDFDACIAMVRAAGSSAAFPTATNAATQANDRFQLPRSRPWDSTRLFYVLRPLRWLAL